MIKENDYTFEDKNNTKRIIFITIILSITIGLFFNEINHALSYIAF